MYILIYEYGFLVCIIGTDPRLLSIYKKERRKTLLLKELRNNNKRRNINTHLSGGSSGQ
jgi:hypothetical protein